MGVPAVTLVGNTPASRVGLSQLSSVGLPEFVATSEDDYVRIAVEAARDLERLARLRAGLRPQLEASPLMDGRRFAANMEAAYRTMWRRWCAEPRA
jgi:protein O-GlcNAc transferase